MTTKFTHFCDLCDEKVNSEHCIYWEMDWDGAVTAICKECYNNHLKDEVKVWGCDKWDNYFFGEDDPNKYEQGGIVWEIVKIVQLDETAWDEYQRCAYLLGDLTVDDCEEFDGLNDWK